MIKTRQSRHSGLIAAYLILVLAVWLFIANLPCPEAVRLPMQTGITDLSASDFSDTVYYYRDNYWENYPGALLLLDGKTRDEISGLLFISIGTVNTHCTNVYRKTGCGSSAELTRLMLQQP